MFPASLKKIVQRMDLTEAEMSTVVDDIFEGRLTDAQIGALMAALATKGETFRELSGASRAMRRKAARIQTTARQVLDTCGTGGDGGGTFNISTTTAFVVAACGVTVAKHGNRSVSSQCGSADLLEALGADLTTPPEIVEEALEEIGIGFLFAPLYHGAMKYAANARREVGLRSIFNLLGPLTNPAAANCQLLGVYAPELTEMFAQTLRLLGTRRAFVVHGHDGLDEISVCAPTRISELRDDHIRTYDLHPEDYGIPLAAASALRGGSPKENAVITRGILGGEIGAPRDVVLLNAAAALVAAGKAAGIDHGLGLAAQAIDSGRAADKMNALVAFTRATR